uniref:Uncharacterized protein n=1 Tax=Cacopsylla melanoneura TaxID=428564 RepID=A0A8D8W6F7_9HEMI
MAEATKWIVQKTNVIKMRSNAPSSSPKLCIVLFPPCARDIVGEKGSTVERLKGARDSPLRSDLGVQNSQHFEIESIVKHYSWNFDTRVTPGLVYWLFDTLMWLLLTHFVYYFHYSPISLH